MTDNEFVEEAYAGMLADNAEAYSREHDLMDEPSETALLHRTFPTHTETMWIQAYPHVRLIAVTCPRVQLPGGGEMPGVVRELPVGWRDMATAQTFRTRFTQVVESYEREGWTRKQISVYAGEPWDVPSVLDKEAGF